MRGRSVGAAFSLAMLAGCAGRGSAETTLEQAAPIVFGEPSPSPDDDAVVLIRYESADGEFLCTATMVAPNLIITARHCVSYVNDGTFQCTVRGEAVASDGGGILGLDVPPESIEIYAGEVPGPVPAAHGQEIVSTLSLTSCLNDLAFVVLDRSLDLPVASVRLGTKTVAGEAVSIVGYGLQQAGPAELDWHGRPRKKAHQVISAVGPDATEDVTTLRARTFFTNGPSACKGDSGGPALSDRTRAVVGVYSIHTGSDDCTSSAVVHSYTHVSPFTSLAMQAFERAHAEPRIERRATFGQACQEASECEEGVCAAGDDGASRCSRACAASAPCPGGYECRPPVKLDGPSVCAALVEMDAGGCSTCDGGPAPPAPTSSGGCVVSRTDARSASTGIAALALASLVFTRRRTSRRRPSRGSLLPSRTRIA